MRLLTKSGVTRRKIFYGWWIVAASSFFNLLVNGTFYFGFTAFFDPLRNEFGWTSAQTAFGVSLQRLESGLAAPFIGYLFDRVGAGRLILPGMIVAGSGLILMSRIQSLTGYYIAFLTTAIGLSIGWLGPPMYAVSNWFIRKRSRALAILMAGSGLGGFLVPLMVLFISYFGWRTSLMGVGVSYCLVGIPLALVLKHRPEQHGMVPDGDEPDGHVSNSSIQNPTVPVEAEYTLKDAARTGAFWLITLSLALSQFAMTAVFVLEMPHLENIGVSRNTAGVTVTWTTLFSLIGSLVGGFLGDVLNKRHLLAAAVLLQSLGLFILASITHVFHIAAFIIIYGIGFGATVPLRPAIVAEYFGRANIGLILGVTMSVILFVSVLSPLTAGWFFDVWGNYRGIFAIYAIILSFGAPAVLAAKRPSFEQPSEI